MMYIHINPHSQTIQDTPARGLRGRRDSNASFIASPKVIGTRLTHEDKPVALGVVMIKEGLYGQLHVPPRRPQQLPQHFVAYVRCVCVCMCVCVCVCVCCPRHSVTMIKNLCMSSRYQRIFFFPPKTRWYLLLACAV
jgi:hypothetical protein